MKMETTLFYLGTIQFLSSWSISKWANFAKGAAPTGTPRSRHLPLAAHGDILPEFVSLGIRKTTDFPFL